ncbi:MAG TPA: PD-(D/E)XK nuclease family protein [Opitutaceae bacterium]|nr:PD-(D/E)XK nuclease family protein [Opitutaceae bacterium]
MSKVTHFLPWDRPLPAQAAAWLAAGRTGKPLDLSDIWVIVPTRQAGRRLREALARHAHGLGTAALAPRVTLPDGVFETRREANRASPSAVRLNWARTLLAARPADFPDLFPHTPERRTFQWALGLGERLAKLRRDLAEGGLRVGEVAARAGAGFPEGDRWTQLAALESQFLCRLQKAGLADPDEARVSLANEPGPPPSNIKRIVLLGCPDPMSLALTLLEAWSATVEVCVVVQGPADRADAFDAWGRPLAGRWPDAVDEPADFESCVHVCTDPAEQSERIAAWATSYEQPDSMLAVGCADNAVVPFITSALSERGIAHFDPEGRSLARGGIARFVTLLRQFANDASFVTACELARRPEIIDWMSARLGGPFAPSRFLAGLDELEAFNLPTSLDFAIEHSRGFQADFPELAPGLELLAGLADDARRATFPRGFLDLLATVLGTGEADRRKLDEVEALRVTIDEVATAGGRDAVDADEGWELTLASLARSRVFEEKPAGALEIMGWLELLWEDAPHVVVAGLNEGCVPESITSDPFLPGALRKKIGLRSNDDRLARDGYILAAMRAARADGGRVDLLLGRRSDAGDPMNPSRLLLACRDEDLPARVRFLFRETPPSRSTVPWARAWTLAIPKPRSFETIRVTAFRDYLACPFRFLLKHGLKMSAVDPEKRELDARDFGTLVHQVLERLGNDDAWRDCTDGAELARSFSAELDRISTDRFGKSLSLPLVVQIESARQRLQHAAHLQAAARAEGWRIEEVEWPFPEGAVVFDGLAVRGKIDRIERHEATGVVRVLDYKTSDKPVSPAEAHRKKLSRGEALRHEFAGCEVAGAPGQWIDLQLPLYRLAAARFGGEVVCGYFNLPKAVTETAIATWDELDEPTQAAAMECARGVAAGVRAGNFWPPNEDARDDEFTRLFHEGVAASIDVGSRPEGGAR